MKHSNISENEIETNLWKTAGFNFGLGLPSIILVDQKILPFQIRITP